MQTPFAPGSESRAASGGEPGSVTGAVRLILRAEGAAALAVCCGFYALTGSGWRMFALLFFAPDLSILFYLIGPRIGAVAYNVMHSSIGPLLLGLVGFVMGIALLPALALIWAGHVGFDRMLGMGLKYPQAFGYTHLGRIGAAARGTLAKS